MAPCEVPQRQIPLGCSPRCFGSKRPPVRIQLSRPNVQFMSVFWQARTTLKVVRPSSDQQLDADQWVRAVTDRGTKTHAQDFVSQD